MKSLLKKGYQLYKRYKYKKINVLVENNVNVSNSDLCEYTRICKNTQFNNSSIGSYSYIGWNSILNNCVVGKFSSIGPYTEIIYGTHPINFVSTSPVFYSTRAQCGISFVNENKFEEFNYVKDTTKSVVIGHDVWIGYGVKLLEGITIHDGAIILAGSIITKDIEPFTVVGGVPSKLIKYRFPDKHIDLMKKIKWWDKDLEWIEKNLDLFTDVEKFSKLIESELL